jgi:hypothetical protein
LPHVHCVRLDRPKERYAVNFSAPDFLDYVPLMRRGCGVSGSDVFTPLVRVGLNTAQLAFMHYVDGRRTIRDIAACVAQSEGQDRNSAAYFEQCGREQFESLWRLDILAMAFNPSPS